MRVASAIALSDTGRKRRRNEDAFLCEPPLFAVADGMGGAQAGEIASQLAAASLREHGAEEVTASERVTTLIREANRRVFSYSSTHASTRGMGTTITVALIDHDTLTIGHVGDSRAYLLRNGQMQQITEDHSLVAELVRSGRLSPEEAETHPQRSVITRALGTEEDVDVDVISTAVEDGDLFLLCSDGLSAMLDDEEILRLLTEHGGDLDTAARSLVEAANKAGGEDNITVVLFTISGSGAASANEVVGDTEKTLTEAEAIPTLSIESLHGARRPGAVRQRILLVTALIATLSALAVLTGWALSWAHFIGAERDGHVAIYQGLPYDLPGGVHLYRPVHISGRILAAQLSVAERQSLFDHHLRSGAEADRELRRLEEAVNP